ncbi:DUF544 family protein [Schizosaccharomyces japonicus yFS275]|uniref:DUF544 family protein n=1 Tax=Schizosaccharomyces japonicus (strain yFS275 / FY16936) TaxID=402676 RepID=B6JY23_SCHJY|nr:DUF544 family protein [Schizosaccharomyces japonicus yFS275]EEB06441.1 DUF544 family protein [Schizosaccharomyces japonicus yFS275]
MSEIAIPGGLKPKSEPKEESKSSTSYATKSVEFWVSEKGVYERRRIVCQTENGPCPIIALINCLVLKSTPAKEFKLPEKKRLTEEQLNALLVQYAEQYNLGNVKDDKSAMDNLQNNLATMHFGQQLNPCLFDVQKFAYGDEVFRLFDIRLVHGWILSQEDLNANEEGTFELLQKIPYYEEIADKLVERSTLLESSDTEELSEEQLDFLQKSSVIADVMMNRYSKQFLTHAGISKILEHVAPGEVLVLFRSNHFSTLFSHPESLSLFTLVTDSGYINAGNDVVWETFDDQVVETGNGELCSAHFVPTVLIIQRRKEANRSQEARDKLYAKQLQQKENQRESRTKTSKQQHPPTRPKVSSTNKHSSRKKEELKPCIIS